VGPESKKGTKAMSFAEKKEIKDLPTDARRWGGGGERINDDANSAKKNSSRVPLTKDLEKSIGTTLEKQRRNEENEPTRA